MGKYDNTSKRHTKASRTNFQSDQRHVSIIIYSCLAAFILSMFIVVFISISGGKEVASTKYLAPTVANAEFGITIPAKDPVANAATLVIYEDFSCPHCKEFEKNTNATLQLLRESGKVNLEYRPVAFLGAWSVRAGSAAACVLEKGSPEAWLKVHNALYENQPNEGSDPGTPKITKILDDTDVTYDKACIKTQAYAPWMVKATKKFSADKVGGTPAILLNGKKIDADALSITKAVDAAVYGK